MSHDSNGGSHPSEGAEGWGKPSEYSASNHTLLEKLSRDVDSLFHELRTVRGIAESSKSTAESGFAESRGAHEQARETNGRVTSAEGQLLRVNLAVFGKDDGSLDDKGGLVGHVRFQRKMTTFIAGWVVVALPVIVTVAIYAAEGGA